MSQPGLDSFAQEVCPLRCQRGDRSQGIACCFLIGSTSMYWYSTPRFTCHSPIEGGTSVVVEAGRGMVYDRGGREHT
jgi:hypothetical protein